MCVLVFLCVCMSVRDVESSTSVAWMFNLIFGGRVAVAPECAFRYMCEYLCVYAEDLRSFMATELGFHSCLIYTFPGTGYNLHKIFIKANSCSTTIIKWFFFPKRMSDTIKIRLVLKFIKNDSKLLINVRNKQFVCVCVFVQTKQEKLMSFLEILF